MSAVEAALKAADRLILDIQEDQVAAVDLVIREDLVEQAHQDKVITVATLHYMQEQAVVEQELLLAVLEHRVVPVVLEH
jgi:acetylglutamate kinase